jgi:hypothetical protein
MRELPDELKSLAKLHPSYTQAELEQAHAQITRHFEDAWQLFLRLKRDGALDKLNLTASRLNPTVKPPDSLNT